MTEQEETLGTIMALEVCEYLQGQTLVGWGKEQSLCSHFPCLRIRGSNHCLACFSVIIAFYASHRASVFIDAQLSTK